MTDLPTQPPIPAELVDMVERISREAGVPMAIYTEHGWVFHPDCSAQTRERLLAEEAAALAPWIEREE